MNTLKNYIFLFFFAIVISLSNFYFHTFSYGFFALALLLHLVFKIVISKKIFIYCILFELLILVQVSLTSGLTYKSTVSSIILVYCGVIFYSFGKGLSDNKFNIRPRIAIPFITAVFFLAVGSFLLARFAGYYLLYVHPKPCFPFEEPSHFAIFIGPLIIYLLPFARGLTRSVLVGTLFLLSVTLESVTFGIYTLLAGAICLWNKFSLKSSFFFSLLAISIFCVDFFINNKYMIERISFVFDPKTINMTALVYLQGWEAIFQTFKHHFFGIGFQFLGGEPPNKYSLIIKDLSGGYVNRQDGGFLLAKIFPEFGFLLIPICAAFIYWLIGSYRMAKLNYPKHSLAVLYIYIGLLPALFIRDVGYFSYTLFYFFCASGYLYGLSKKPS